MNWHTSIIVRNLGLCDYPPVMEAMRIWTCRRTPSTLDEIWMLEHLPVYTRGVSCRDKPRKLRKKIELIDSDRGGQITYHGPGQVVVYLLLDLRRLGLGVRKLVALMEQTAIDFLREHKIDANVTRLIHYSPETKVSIFSLSESPDNISKSILSLPNDMLVFAIGNQVGEGQKILQKL